MENPSLSVHPAASILGNAPSIRTLRDQIQRLASFDTIGNPQVPTLLLQGETGTGKGLVARVTHESGPRANGPFIELGCAAIPENLLEAELFGFEAGAFTDAKRAKAGLFEAASGGTLFLDDVDTLPLPLQAKFLKVIEAKWVRRLGSLTDQQVDVKLIAATQRDLRVYVNEGRFREDLYHRLAVVILKIPPLRERTEDIVLLSKHFLHSSAEAHSLSPKQLGQTAEEWLLNYSWPGNVRELGHLMERATLLIPESVLDAGMLEHLAATGEHLWANSYDREAEDIFAIQDEITLEILKSLQVKLTHGESALTTHATENAKAWEASVQGWWHYRAGTKEDNEHALRLWRKAVELDPEFGLAYALLGLAHLANWTRGWSDDPRRSLEKAEELAHRALSMDDSIAGGHALLSHIYMSRGQYEDALAERKRAVALQPNNPNLLQGYAHQLMLLGRADESVTMVERALDLHPTRNLSLLRLAGRVYYYAGRYDKAIAASKKYLELDPDRTSPRVVLIASLVAEGREREARAQAKELIERRPDYSITRTHSKRGFFHNFKDPQHWERLASRLRRAGLAE